MHAANVPSTGLLQNVEIQRNDSFTGPAMIKAWKLQWKWQQSRTTQQDNPLTSQNIERTSEITCAKIARWRVWICIGYQFGKPGLLQNWASHLISQKGSRWFPPFCAETESDAIYRDVDTSMFKKTKDMTPNQADGGQKFATTRLSLLMTTTHTWWRCRSCLRRTPRTPRYQCWCLCWYRCCEILSAKCPG